jgi:hypothetical protein
MAARGSFRRGSRLHTMVGCPKGCVEQQVVAAFIVGIQKHMQGGRMGNRGWRMWSTVAGLAVFGASTAGCLEAREGLESEGPAPAPAERSTMQIVAPFEEGDSDASVSAGDLDACAETGNTCLETSDDAVACLRGYGTCAVAAGLDARHPFLGCIEGLASCWEASSVDDDACLLAFEICVEPLASSEDPGEGGGNPTPDDPPGLCEAEVVACYDNPANGDAVCAAVYRDCLVAAGVEGPYVDCLDDVVVCLGSAQDEDGCYLAFEICVDDAYPSDDDAWEDSEDDHDPGEEREPFLCEEPIWIVTTPVGPKPSA